MPGSPPRADSAPLRESKHGTRALPSEPGVRPWPLSKDKWERSRTDLSPVLSPATYKTVLHDLHIPVNASPHWSLISVRHGVPVEALMSIHSQLVTLNVIRTTAAKTARALKLLPTYQSGQKDILDIASEIDFPPCLLWRRILQHAFLPEVRVPKSKIGDLLKHPHKLMELAAMRELVRTDQRALALARRLVRDAPRCMRSDSVYAPWGEVLRATCGAGYEALLCEHMDALGVGYWAEEELRRIDMHKTPDVKLHVPIMVDGHIVHWIDSKAMFGDAQRHRELVQGTADAPGQFQGYCSRYGTGMVIYWHGHVVGIQEEDGRVLVCHEWPDRARIRILPTLDQLPQP